MFTYFKVRHRDIHFFSLFLFLFRDWSPIRMIWDVLGEIYELIHRPEVFDPDVCFFFSSFLLPLPSSHLSSQCSLSQRSWLSELMRVNPQDYYENARENTRQHANGTLEAFKKAHNIIDEPGI